jgi:DNA-directed RNA polymerase II subunit RPB1
MYDRHATRIRRIHASIWKDEAVLNYSVCKDTDDSISRPEMYEAGNQPKRGGLVDSRLGVTSRSGICGHCGLSSSQYDPGHFGHTVLARRKFNVVLLGFVQDITNMHCLKCTKPLVNYHEIAGQLKLKKSARARWSLIKKLAKKVKFCSNCHIPTPKITVAKTGSKQNGSIELVAEYKGSTKEDGTLDTTQKTITRLGATRVYEILNNIDDDDCYMIGMDPKIRNHMRDFIPKILPFPPNTVRPAVFMDGSSDPREDQMTHKLANIIKANAKEMKHNIEAGSDIHAPDLVQYEYATYLDTKSVVLPRSEQKGAPAKAIRDRIKGKGGRVRSNLMGKRVDFSGRSVISPDPSISTRQIFVPMRMAMQLTYPEMVTPENIKRLREAVKRGHNSYPGANFLMQMMNGEVKNCIFLNYAHMKKEPVVSIGDIVCRHLIDDDIVLFNRQPTLHRPSMQAHKVRVIPGDWATLRMHVSGCEPYNADFDGDEMNIHVPQSELTKIELKILGSVDINMISPGKCRPMDGTVHDNTVITYLLSDDRIRIPARLAMNIMSNCGLPIEELQKLQMGKTYSGKQLLSMLISKGINATLKSPKGDVVIKDGTVQEPGGNLTKTAFGAVREGLLHQHWHEYRQQGSIDQLDRVNTLTTAYNRYDPFSVGYGSVLVPKKVRKQIISVINTTLMEVGHLITEAETSSIPQDVAVIESVIQGKLNAVRDIVGNTAVNALGEDNAFNLMVAAGSKGSLNNTSQMCATVGQQALEGARIQKKMYGRALPEFYQHDDSGIARGYVVNNYNTGLNTSEFIFHTMCAREGQIDTNIKTAETGYFQRRLVKAMEDLMVQYDGTVRTAGGAMLQTIYGYNGTNPIYQGRVTLKMLLQNNEQLRNLYSFTEDECKKYGMSAIQNDNLYRHMIFLRDQARSILMRTSRNCLIFDEKVTSPINFEGLLRKYENWKHKYPNEAPLDPTYILSKIEMMLGHDQTPLMCISKKQQKSPDCVKLKDEDLAKTFLRTIFFECLNPKKLIVQFKFGRERFDAMCEEAVQRFEESIVAPGEMVGVIGGQSVGEPMTQLSVSKHTEVIVMCKEGHRTKVFRGPVHELIDWIINKHPEHTYKCAKSKIFKKTEISEKSKDFYKIEKSRKSRDSDKIEEAKDIILDSVETDVAELDKSYYIASLQKDETIKWVKISAVSRHPSNGKLVRFKTRSGREIIATPAHSFLKRTQESFKEVRAKDLKKGDRMPVCKNLPRFLEDNPKTSINVGDFTLKLDKLSGWFIGTYLADGWVNGSIGISKVSVEYQKMVKLFAKQYDISWKLRQFMGTITKSGKYANRTYLSESLLLNSPKLSKFLLKTCGTGSSKKRVPTFVHGAPLEFIAGVVQGYFDGDGNVQADGKRHMIRCHSVNKPMITDFAILLNYLGIYASICKEKGNDPSGTGKMRNPLFTLQIPHKYGKAFLEKAGTCYEKRKKELNKMAEFSERDDAPNQREEIDKIPELGACIGRVGTGLHLEGASRNYCRWEKKASIGRKTLQDYVKLFDKEVIEFEAKLKENNKCCIKKSGNKFAWYHFKKSKGNPDGCHVKETSCEYSGCQARDPKCRYIGCHLRQSGSGFTHTPILESDIKDLHKDIEILRQAANSDVIWDEIIEYETIEDPVEHVYDFSVPGTETFMIGNGLFTHNTLKTFHSAGVAGKSQGNLGVPRARELLSGSKNPKTPRMTIRLQEKYENNYETAQRVASEIRFTTMSDITSSMGVYYEPDPFVKGGWMEKDNAKNVFMATKCQSDVTGLPWLMRIVLNREGMLGTGLQLNDIKSKICQFWQNKTKEAKKLKRRDEKQAMEGLMKLSIASNYSLSDELVIHIRYDTNAVNYGAHVALCQILQKKIKLKGLEGITGSVEVIDENYKAIDHKTGALEEKHRYSIVTEGVNLVDLRYLNYVDMNKVTTNHVTKNGEVLGIEVMRASLKRELKTVIEGGGAEADYRHLCLLADLATNTGDFIPIDRHGMMKADADFLAKASNETTVEQLIASCFFGDVDNMQNVSSRLMVGAAFNGGSNLCKVFLDFDALQNMEVLPEEMEHTSTFQTLTENKMIDNILQQTAAEEDEDDDSD